MFSLASISTALHLALAPPAASSATEPPSRTTTKVGGFVGVDWRVMGLAGHVSHGPGFQAGAILWSQLKLGIGGFARPGPINPSTFRVPLPDGRTYKGQDTLKLRSDGTVVGLLIAPIIEVPRIPWLTLEFPVILGYAGFGFYLSGEDRKTPDGRRVSEWEDELLDGRDSDPASMALDVGVRATFALRRTPWIAPYFGVHYTAMPGFDTVVRDSYDGVSGVLGIQFGYFPLRHR